MTPKGSISGTPKTTYLTSTDVLPHLEGTPNGVPYLTPKWLHLGPPKGVQKGSFIAPYSV